MKEYKVKYKTAGGSLVYSYFDKFEDCYKRFNEAASGRILISTVNR